MDQSISLISAANAVVQDPASIGTAFKTLSARIRGATTELEEAGLETDGMATSTAKLRAEIKALSGVEIMADENTFRSTYDILDDLATKWKELTDIQQASIIELIAGKRQANVVAALMNNFDIAREALEVSRESAGSAMIEENKYLESLAARINILKAAFEELSEAFMNDDVLRSLIDTGTNLLSILTKIIQTFGSFPTVIGVAAGALSATKNVGRTKRRPLNMPTIMLFCPIGQFYMMILAIQGLNEAPICGKPGTPRLHFPFGDESES